MYWVRVGMMIMTLLVVIWTMISLRSGRSPAVVLSEIFLSPKTAVELCPTRIASLRLSEGSQIGQIDGKWIRSKEGGEPEELHAIEVEKWLGQYCSLPSEPAETGEDFQVVLGVSFVTGQYKQLKQAATGEYLWEEKLRFRSPGLDGALRALANLPLEHPVKAN